jgi:uncharacterized membrane protein
MPPHILLLDIECKVCKKTKHRDDFYKGQRTTCKPCYNQRSKQWAKENPDAVKKHRKKKNLKEKYGLSVEEYDKMFQQQGGRCYLCHSDHPRRALNVDHCHTTGTIRELLCDRCNMALGLLKDDIALIDKIRRYLVS